MVQKLRERTRGEGGFTLVELLVVMLILGLLAAIAIPAFFNQRNKAYDADAKAVARTAQTAMETYASDNRGSYAGADEAALQDIEPTLSNADGLSASGGEDGYTITVTSDSDNTFTIRRDAPSGSITYECVTRGEAGCPSDGNWGN